MKRKICGVLADSSIYLLLFGTIDTKSSYQNIYSTPISLWKRRKVPKKLKSDAFEISLIKHFSLQLSCIFLNWHSSSIFIIRKSILSNNQKLFSFIQIHVCSYWLSLFTGKSLYGICGFATVTKLETNFRSCVIHSIILEIGNCDVLLILIPKRWRNLSPRKSRCKDFEAPLQCRM